MTNKRSLFWLPLIAGACVTALVAWAPSVVRAEEGPAGPGRIYVPRLEASPRLEDFEGMKPGGAALGMSRVSDLVNRTPRDGVPASERTEVYFGYDSVQLYAVFVCFDSEPSQISAHLNGRDHVADSEDSVALQIDTFRDRKHAYGFQVNALGVQQDGLYTEGKGWDLSFDTAWRTESRMTKAGYMVMVSVPFKSLRFSHEDIQHWGLLVFRAIPRKNEWGFWPAYSTRIAGRMNQAAVVEGLDHVSPGRNAQIVPYFGARSLRLLEVDPRQGGRFISDPGETQVGADAKVVVKDSLSLDLTANPDFSQVESDEPQITVNKRFETFFPEKRPFFLENASYFDTPIPLLFTRRILDPDFGGRVTGRLGPYALGVLAVRDQPGATAADIFVVRLNRDLGKESSLGGFASSRGIGEDFNRLAGIDARVKLGGNWFATAQVAASRSREADGRRLEGSGIRAILSRAGRRLAYRADLNDRSSDFRSALGFLERTNIRSVDQVVSYRWMPAHARLLSFGPEVSVVEVRDHGNRPLDRSVTPRFSFEWPGQTTLSIFHQSARVTLRPEEVPLLDQRKRFSQDVSGFELSTNFARFVSLTLNGSAGEGINLVPPAGGQPRAADSSEVNAGVELRPSIRLSAGANCLLTRLEDASGARIFSDRIVRARANYQFTRAASLRTILQYEIVVANDAFTSLASRRNLNLDVLFTYLRTPGTALYVGYNNNLQDFDPSLRPGPGGLRHTGRQLLSDGRQFFVKVSYLFRK